MSIEQERADFEAWCAKQSPVLLTHVWTDNPDRYASDYTQAAWEAWQARAALQSPEIQALRNDAERYRYIKKGNQWVVAATQTGAQVDGGDLDALIDSEMEQS